MQQPQHLNDGCRSPLPGVSRAGVPALRPNHAPTGNPGSQSWGQVRCSLAGPLSSFSHNSDCYTAASSNRHSRGNGCLGRILPLVDLDGNVRSRSLWRTPAIVSFLNEQPALSLVRRNRSSCPNAALGDQCDERPRWGGSPYLLPRFPRSGDNCGCRCRWSLQLLSRGPSAERAILDRSGQDPF